MKRIIILILVSGLGLSVFAQAFTIDSSFAPFFDIRSQRNVTITNLFEYQSGKVIIQGNFRLNFNNTLFSGVLSTSRIGNIVTNYQVLNGNNSSNILLDINSNKFYFGVGNSNGKLIDSLGNDINPSWQTNFFKTVSCFQGTPYFYPNGTSIFPNGFSQTANGPCPIINAPDTFPGRHLVKVKPDGLWDSTFSAFPNYPPSGVIRYDGNRLLVYGSPSQFTHYNGVRVNGLCRIFHDGSLDTTFTSPMVDTSAFNVIVPRLPDSSGKIYLCGKFLIKDYPNQYNTLVRLTAEGRLDSTFSFNNGPTHNIVHGGANVIVKTSDNGYLVGGTFNSYQGSVVSSIAKIDSNGIIEPQYFSNGGPDSSGVNTLGIPTVNKILKSKFGGYYVAGNFLKWDGQSSQPIVRIHGLQGSTVGIGNAFPERSRSAVLVYPNPTTGIFNLESEVGIENVEVYDLSGLQLSLSLTNSKKLLNLTNFDKGIYFLKIELENGEIITKKVVKN